MRPSFREMAPDAAAWIEQAAAIPVLQYINETAWITALIGTAHILTLILLGGAMLVLNLRVLGVALVGVPLPQLYRIVRPALIAGIIGSVLSGGALGLATLAMLLSNPAFLVKMVALLAGIGLTLVVMRGASDPDAPGEGLRRGAALLAVVSTAVWILALGLFATTAGLGPGAYLVALAGLALFAVFVRHGRKGYWLAMAVVLGAGIIAVEWFSGDGVEGPAWLPLLPLALALAIAGRWGWRQRAVPGWSAPTPLALAAFASTLTWITVAAAGRWIAFA